MNNHTENKACWCKVKYIYIDFGVENNDIHVKILQYKDLNSDDIVGIIY